MIPLLPFGALGLAARTAIKLAPTIAPVASALTLAAATAIAKNKATETTTKSENQINDYGMDHLVTAGSSDTNTLRNKAEKFKEYLPNFRALLDWTTADLAQKLDLSRQAISAIEKKDSGKLSVVQYIAIKTLIMEELIKRNDIRFFNLVSMIFNALVENPEMYTKEQQKDIEEKFNKFLELKTKYVESPPEDSDGNANSDNQVKIFTNSYLDINKDPDKDPNQLLIKVFGESLFNDQDPALKDTIKSYEHAEDIALNKFSSKLDHVDSIVATDKLKNDLSSIEAMDFTKQNP